MTGIARWQEMEEFERLARLSNEDYQQAAARGIRKREEEIHKRQRETRGSLNGIACSFEFGKYYFHVFEDWCKGFEGGLEFAGDPTWNYSYDPNYQMISAVLKEVKSQLTKEKVDTLFEKPLLSVANPRLKEKYRIKTIKAKLKTPLEGRKAILEGFFDNLKFAYLKDSKGHVAITSWIKAVKPMFKSALNDRNDWDKLLFFIDTISQHTTGILDEHSEIRSVFTPVYLPARLGVSPPPAHVEKERGRYHPANLFKSRNLAQHRRIGRRQATIRGVETFGEAQDGGLLLA